MKKIAWLMVAYVVVKSTTNLVGVEYLSHIKNERGEAVSACLDDDFCKDWAEALNQAHDKRIRAKEDAEFRATHNGCYKMDCNICCPMGGGGYECTAMSCLDSTGKMAQ